MIYTTENIRTVALLGHGGAGKTTLSEALLARAGAIQAPGSVEKARPSAILIRSKRAFSIRCALQCCI